MRRHKVIGVQELARRWVTVRRITRLTGRILLMFCLSSVSILAASGRSHDSATKQVAKVSQNVPQRRTGSAKEPIWEVLNRLAADGISQDKQFLGKTRFSISQTDHTYSYDSGAVATTERLL
jgi:hypothetical protein